MAADNEFSRVFEIDELPADGRELHIEAKPAERAALARRFGILGLDSVVADATLTPAGRAIRVAGRFDADVVQACVVTLEPVATHVSEGFSVLFERDVGADMTDRVHLIDPDEEDIDILAGSTIDLGEVVAEQLALALPPYPRKPGVEFRPYTTDPGAEKPVAAGPSPFSGLDKLLRKQ
ncbi:MAG: DUF177 domain-containing protein [Alphaproteobacteria bacterium]